eukprot:CAMPEP_0198147092 /NCGR_PEP_ID=MMETSP1443-20131203/33198_1 /TAXON_ID=186043 /ORGANISM="Entomoneis sp., Strain CCMP2396" /LENGTH=387 /DNA_ID=CAMNT_0043811247 /DNA_START=76 /DNA_END=1239 /DNA_ORIENTATION=+
MMRVSLLLLGLFIREVFALQQKQPQLSREPLSRRKVLLDVPTAAALVGSQLLGPKLALASPIPNADSDSSVFLPRSHDIHLPRIGYSTYKTAPEQVAEGVGLALQAGTRHLDCASQYGINSQVGSVIKRYLQTGEIETRNGMTKTPRRKDRQVYVTHKVSNIEQSLSNKDLKSNILQQAKTLGKNLDLVMIHSPLTDSNRRLSTYATLCDLYDQKKIGAVGVCHFGVKPLQELVDAGLPPPSVIQLELSPFNLHKDVSEWATSQNSLLSCAAWSRLSSKDGPTQAWDTLAKEVAQPCKMTKQQVLIRWAVQQGYLCVPRSNSQYKAERQAILENSWGATKDFVLTDKEMQLLNSLNEQTPAGQLSIVDGWDLSDIVDPTWDPTTAIV